MTIKELKEAIANCNDNDEVTIEIHEGVRHEDLYEFSIEKIHGIRLMDGTEISEIRLCI